MFYEILDNLCKSKNTTVSAVVKTLELSTSKVTAWKNGSIPKGDILLKIADYFNISVDYLLGRNNTSKAPTEINPIYSAYNSLNDEGKKQAMEYIEMLKNTPKYNTSHFNSDSNLKIAAKKTPTHPHINKKPKNT